MAAAGFWNNPEQAKKVNQEATRLRAQLARWEKMEKDLEDARVLLELAEEEGDEAALKEVDQSLADLEERLGKFKLERMLSGEHDAKSCILSINAGAGGTEAQDWAQMLLRMYLRYCERAGLAAELIDELPGEEAGIKSATLTVTGEYAYGYLKAESGVHRLVRISPFDANKRRHTSFAAVFVLPDIEEDIEVEINPDDLRIDTFRSSGAGGQHVNKTSSAVRITHFPTGIVVTCQNERSQHKNKAMAMKVLKAKLYEHERAKRDERMQAFHSTKKDIEWGSQIRSYVLQPYQMVKDTRTGHETGNVQAVLDGELQSFIEAYLAEQAQSAGGKSSGEKKAS